LGTNNADRNTQILIELLQGYIQMQNLEHIVTTDIYKPEFLTEIENLVHERITTMKQKRIIKNKPPINFVGLIFNIEYQSLV
jgi:hypothetical protein